MLPMQNKQNTPYFTVTTMAVDDNRKLGSAIRDGEGYFTDIPVAVLGTVTRNMTQYDTPEFIAQLKGPDTSIFRRITEGTLFSEWGHPFVDLNSHSGLARLLNLDPQKESNRIRSISVKHIDDLGLDLVLMDAKGSGPFGKYFDEAMEDPTRNIAFSLRGISKANYDQKTRITHKKLVSLATFDSGVASGGFREASKRYMAAKEDIHFESTEIVNQAVGPDDIAMIRSISMESFTDTEVNELMKSSKVVIGTVNVGYIDKATKTLFDTETGQKRSLFHSFINTKR